ncbi:MAG: glycosyltransferase [Gemmatimonadales bacterium]
MRAPMRVTIIGAGSRGDVQPYVALGRGLRAAGHEVTLATHETFREFVTGHGLAFAPVAGDPRAMVAAADRWIASGRNRHVLPVARDLLRRVRPLLTAWLSDFWRVAQGSDVLVFSPVATPAWSVAERLGIPGVAAYLQPLHRTRHFAAVGVPSSVSLGSGFNVATHILTQQLMWLPVRRQINAWRRDTLGLPAIRGGGPLSHTRRVPLFPTMYAFSSLVVPKPPDWDPAIRLTGYWVLPPDSSWRPPRELEAFLAAGPPPVYIGFGSMTPASAGRLTAIAVEALATSGQRGVLLGGWGAFGEGALPSSVIAVRDVPHEWLLPRMRAVVHHGGAGTTGAALRAGVPSIVVPLGFDQPFWGRRVHALGVGPRPISRRRLSASGLADAIRTATGDSAMRARAASLGAELRAERGVERAIAELAAIADPDRRKGRGGRD